MPTEDNWAHRSEGMCCSTCMWFQVKFPEGDLGASACHTAAELAACKGRCRRRAPTLGGWPVMFPTDWCGDHKLA